MKLAFICNTIDAEDPIHAAAIDWIRALATEPEVDGLSVITVNEGVHDLDPPIPVHEIRGRTRAGKGLSFLRLAGEEVRCGTDAFFIYQGGDYPTLLQPFRRLFGTEVYQWKAHPHVSRKMEFMARWCDDAILTSTPSAFPLNLDHVHVIGTSVNCDRFQPRDTQPKEDLLMVCRLSPVKRIELVIEAVRILRDRHGEERSLTIVGPQLDKEYQDELLDLVQESDLEEQVTFTGPMEHADLPEVMRNHRLFVMVAGTAVDRAAVESMASGTPVFTTNECVGEILPPHLREKYYSATDDPEELAERIRDLLYDDASLSKGGAEMRKLVEKEHSKATLGRRILHVIESNP